MKTVRTSHLGCWISSLFKIDNAGNEWEHICLWTIELEQQEGKQWP